MATINGTSGNDHLIGTNRDFFGYGGDDTIHGLAGNDTIEGGDGSNQLFGDDGDDVFPFAGYAPQPTIVHSSIDGGSGFDTLDFTGVTTPDYEFIGISSNDGVHARVSVAAATIIDSATGFEQIIGSTGPLYLQFDDSTTGANHWTAPLRIVSHSAAGTDSDIRTGYGDDTVIGGQGLDNVYIVGGNDTVTLTGQGGALDVEHVSGAGDHVIATADPSRGYVLGIDADALTAGPVMFDLAAGTGSLGATTFSLHGFESVVVPVSGAMSTVLGDNLANTLQVSGIVDGRGGDDTISGNALGDSLNGGDGNDIIDGYGYNDVLNGGAGDDQLSGGDGTNIINGGDGNDYIWAAADYQYGLTSFLDSFYRVFHGGLVGGYYGSTVYDETLNGGAGADHIYGGYRDLIDAGDDSDYVNGMQGADTIHGGSGQDRLFGGADADTISGDADPDHINGNKGDDTLDGGDGNDFVRGGQDDDFVAGGTGDDTLMGDLGNDTIQGGTGLDRLTGGDGNDLFLFGTSGALGIPDATYTGTAARIDDITDFHAGQDRIALGFVPLAVLTGGTQATVAAAEAAAQALLNNHAGDHEVAAISIGSDTYLFFSATGANAIDSAIRLDGVPPMDLSLAAFA